MREGFEQRGYNAVSILRVSLLVLRRRACEGKSRGSNTSGEAAAVVPVRENVAWTRVEAES